MPSKKKKAMRNFADPGFAPGGFIQSMGFKQNPKSEHLRYLGTLGLLAECSVHVPEDLREMIQEAFDDACKADPQLKQRRILNRLEIEVDLHAS